MATFTIDSDNNIAAQTGPPANAENLQSFATEKELAKSAADRPASRLMEVWNSFAGVAPFDELKPVKKFTSRKPAVRRICQAVARLFPDGAPPATPVAPEAKSKTYMVAQFDPKTMAWIILAYAEPDPAISVVATGVVIGDALWIGAAAADGIAYRPLPRPATGTR
jgi:hypothetical protein